MIFAFDLSDITHEDTMQAFGFGGDSVTTAYTVATEIPVDMIAGRQYRIFCTTLCWVRLVVAGEATLVAAKNGAGSIPIPALSPVLIAAVGSAVLNGSGVKVPQTRISVIQDAAGGTLTISEVVQSTG